MEQRITELEKSMVKLDGRIESLVGAMERMAVSVEKMADTSSHMHILEERCDARSLRFDEADNVLHKRVDKVIVDVNKELDDQLHLIEALTANQSKAMWLIVTLFVVAIGKVVFL